MARVAKGQNNFANEVALSWKEEVQKGVTCSLSSAVASMLSGRGRLENPSSESSMLPTSPRAVLVSLLLREQCNVVIPVCRGRPQRQIFSAAQAQPALSLCCWWMKPA